MNVNTGLSISGQVTLIQVDPSIRSINRNGLSILDGVHGSLHVDYCRDAVLSGNDGSMRKLAADFQHNSADEGKDRRPSWICGLGNQNISRREAHGLAHIQYDTCTASRSSITGRNAL